MVSRGMEVGVGGHVGALLLGSVTGQQVDDLVLGGGSSRACSLGQKRTGRVGNSGWLFSHMTSVPFTNNFWSSLRSELTWEAYNQLEYHPPHSPRSP